MKKKLIISITSIMAAVVICLATGIGLLLGFGGKSDAAIVTITTPLFMRNGEHNTALADQLMNLANATPTATRTMMGSTHEGADARRIAASNGTTNAPTVKLFESLGPMSTAGLPATTGTAVNVQSYTNLSNLEWRLSYITHKGNDDPIFTFYATGTYRNNGFNYVNNYGDDYNTLQGTTVSLDNAGSEIRQTLNADFENMTTWYSNIDDVFATPLQVGWQGFMGQTWSITDGRHNLTGERLNDKVWLPSGQEVGDDHIINNGDGINNVFNLNTAEKAYTTNGFFDYAYLRSAQSNSPATIRVLNTSGTFTYGGDYWSGFYAVRPAIHITLGSIATPPPAVTDTNPLFMQNGNHNTNLADELLSLANSAPRSTRTLLGSTHEGSDARQIATANNTVDAPTVKLFEPLGAFSTTGMPATDGTAVNNQSRDNLSNLEWRLSYITYPTIANPIFTFYATEAYRENQFNHTDPNNHESDYNTMVGTTESPTNLGSEIRQTLNNDFANMIVKYQNVSEKIVSPLQVGWQGNLSNTHTYTTGRHNLTGDRLYDKIWLPSGQEVGDTETANNTDGIYNLFGLNTAEQSYNYHNLTSVAWLRSSSPGHSSSARDVAHLGGRFYTANGTSGDYDVRPALHITLGSINAFPPIITSQPESQTLNLGQTVMPLSLTAMPADRNFTYQWFTDTNSVTGDGYPISGAVSRTYTPTNITNTGLYYFYCVVTNTYNGTPQRVTSACAVINVREAPTKPIFSTQPQSAGVNQDSTLTLTAAASGNGTVTYEWHKGGDASDTTTVNKMGDGESFNPSTATVGTSYYYVKAINTFNDETKTEVSDVVYVTVNPIAKVDDILFPPDDPESPPSSTGNIEITALNGATIYVGDKVDLSIVATAEQGGDLGYEWYLNGKNSNSGGAIIENQTLPTYTDIDTSIAGTYYYYVKVTLTLNETTANKTSNVATIVVNEPPVDEPEFIDPDGAEGDAVAGDITISSLEIENIYVGDEVTLSITATVTDNGILSYEWFKNSIGSTDGGIPVGMNSPLLTIGTDIAGTYYYYVTVTNSLNGQTRFKTSNVIPIVIKNLTTAKMPVITTEPADVDIVGIQNFTLSVTAEVPDEGNPSYQWYESTTYDGIGIPVGELTELTLNKTAEGSYYYYVIVTNTLRNERGADTFATKKSRVATVAVDIPVSLPPENVRISAERTVNSGDSVTLYVNATLPAGGGTLKYKWYKNDINSNTDGILIDGAESREYTFDASLSGIWYYYATVFNDVSGMEPGKADSPTVKITVKPVINFAQNLSTDLVVISKFRGSHQFSVTMTANSDVTYAYLWQVSPNDDSHWGTVSGGNAPQWSFNSVTPGFFYIRVLVTGTSRQSNETFTELESYVALVQVNEIKALAPQIVDEPDSVEVTVGDEAVLSVAVQKRDDGELSYQWYVSDTEHGDAAAIQDANESTYSVSSPSASTKYYFVVITNTVPRQNVHTENTATVSSKRARVTVNPIQVIPPEKPVVVVVTDVFVQVSSGYKDTIKFEINADITTYGNLSYQWYKCDVDMKNAVEIAGANQNTYTPTNTAAGRYYYFVRVTNTSIENPDNKTSSDSALITFEILDVSPNNTNLVLYIVLGVLAGVIVVGAVVTIIIVKRKKKHAMAE